MNEQVQLWMTNHLKVQVSLQQGQVLHVSSPHFPVKWRSWQHPPPEMVLRRECVAHLSGTWLRMCWKLRPSLTKETKVNQQDPGAYWLSSCRLTSHFHGTAWLCCFLSSSYMWDFLAPGPASAGREERQFRARSVPLINTTISLHL